MNFVPHSTGLMYQLMCVWWRISPKDAVRSVSFLASFTGLSLAATASASLEALDAHSAGTPSPTLLFQGSVAVILCIFCVVGVCPYLFSTLSSPGFGFWLPLGNLVMITLIWKDCPAVLIWGQLREFIYPKAVGGMWLRVVIFVSFIVIAPDIWFKNFGRISRSEKSCLYSMVNVGWWRAGKNFVTDFSASTRGNVSKLCMQSLQD